MREWGGHDAMKGVRVFQHSIKSRDKLKLKLCAPFYISLSVSLSLEV